MAGRAIGSSDLLFALDSIPAVLGVTEEAFIVFAANAFALLGLRALYFLITGLLDRLVYLSTGLSMILAFIGVKLLLHYGHLQDDAIPEVQTSTSLVVIVVVLAITVGASLLKSRRDPEAAPTPARCATLGRSAAHRATERSGCTAPLYTPRSPGEARPPKTHRRGRSASSIRQPAASGSFGTNSTRLARGSTPSNRPAVTPRCRAQIAGWFWCTALR